jgi:hypothetical protein
MFEFIAGTILLVMIFLIFKAVSCFKNNGDSAED